MLYLAEVQKKSGGVFGGNKAELKLLACQRGEQNWSAVPGEEVIAAPEDANKFGDGALVLVELTANRQVQRIESGRQLVGILQNYSRQQEKFKNKEEEIEQWKESLTYQAQELNRREMEIQARQEQLEQLEQEIDRLEQRRNEIDGSREESERLKEEIERNRQELEGAWDHLRGEMRRLEERQGQLQQVTGPVLDEQQARQIQEILNGLSGSVVSGEPWQQLNLALEIVAAEQGVLDQHWGQLEQQRGAAQNQQAEVDRQAASIQERWGMWQQAQDSLLSRRSELKGLQDTLALKQEYAQSLSLQLRSQDDLIGEVQRLVAMSSDVKLSQQIDIATLERMPLGDLQAIVQNRQQELERAKSFVRDQEEELGLQQQMLDEIQKAIQQANDQERQNLQTELSDEQDRYQMLEESLLGCRRTLREREEIFAEHMKVLRRRQGMDDTDGGENQKIDLGPVLRQLEASRQQQAEELQKLEREIEQKRSSIQQAQGMVDHQTQEQENQRQELKQLEQSLQAQRTAAAELLGRVKLYEETLQPIQDKVSELKQKLEEISPALNQIQECGNYQRWAVGEMGQILMSLMSNQAQQLAS